MGNEITSSVDVAIDPETAFRVFTEEVNCWWLQGPINFHDSSKAYEVRIESGVGGRVMEVYDCESGDGLELGRITTWQPGELLSWQSAIDDVATTVSFDAVESGTRVTVTARIPSQGTDAGSTAWVRMVPVWLEPWVEKRETVAHTPESLSRLAIAVHYAAPAAAARWLRDVFLLEPSSGIPDEEPEDLDHTWLEFNVGNAPLIVLGMKTPSEGPPSHRPWIFVDDVDAHFDHVRAQGATITQEIVAHGARWYEVKDPEGHAWAFAQAGPRM